MTKRLRSIVTLTVCSLLGVLLLQVYFGYQVFQQHSATLKQEVDRALTEAIRTSEEDRVNRINDLFAQDIRNPELVKLSLLIEDEEPKILLSDPETGNVHVSIRFREEVDSTKITQQLQEEIIKYNRNFLEESSVMYWTDKVGERLAKYSDSIQISQAYLEQELRYELDTLNINSDFQVILSDSIDSSTTRENMPPGAYEAIAKIDGFSSVSINLNAPGWEVLRRSVFIYLMTAIILLLIMGSFLALLRFVQRQKRLSQLKDDFIDNVTHELLTPITTLKLALETMRQDKALDKANKYLDVSEQQAERIAEVVDHILQVSFVSEQKAGIQIKEVPLNCLIEEVIDYHRVTSQKPIEIVAALGPEYQIQTDEKHLLNVLHNLMGNAVKYTPASGAKLRIEIKEKDQQLHINIKDNGPGIPKPEQDSIFEKFHRVTNGETHEIKGMGIGLYYAKKIMEQLGGALRLVESTSSGSTFSIILPYANNKS